MKIVHGIPTIRTAEGKLLAACLFVVFQFISPDLAAVERQKIHVNFHIEGQQFDNLPASGRARIKAEVVKKFSTVAENEWGFIDWSPEPSSSTDAIEWEITLKLVTRNVSSDGGGVSTGFIVTLEHSGKLPDNVLLFKQTEDSETIYALGAIIPFQNADDLGDDISRRLDSQLGVLLKSEDVWKFLQNIPIVEQLIAEETRIVVPVNFRDLRSEDDSVLKIKISGDNSSGSLKMKTANEVKDQGQYHGFVIGFVTELMVQPLDSRTGFWDPSPELTEAINSAIDVKVYMDTYNASLAGTTAVDGDTITEPDL